MVTPKEFFFITKNDIYDIIGNEKVKFYNFFNITVNNLIHKILWFKFKINKIAIKKKLI